MSPAGQPGHAPDESDAYTQLVVQVRGWREAGDYCRADQMARAGITAVEQTLGPTARELVVLLNTLVACRAKLASLLAATPSAPHGGTHT